MSVHLEDRQQTRFVQIGDEDISVLLIEVGAALMYEMIIVRTMTPITGRLRIKAIALVACIMPRFK